MRQKLGALLCVALGAVLIFSGINGSAAGSVGVAPMQCGSDTSVGLVNPGTCPTGTITLTEATVLTADPAATAPDSWQVTVKSVGDNLCNLPGTGTTQNVPNDGGPVTFDGLFIFQDTTSDTYCQYELTETAVDGFTGTYAPAAPYSFVYQPPLRDLAGTSGARAPRVQAPSPISVVLTNVAAAPPVTTTPTRTRTQTTTPTRTVTSSASSSPVTTATSTPPIACGTDASGQFRQQRCVNPFPSNSSDPASASTSPALANTGPNRPVRPSLYIGIALCLLGLVLLVAGRRRPRGEHA